MSQPPIASAKLLIQVWLEELLKQRKITAAELARQTKLSRSTIGRMLGKGEDWPGTPGALSVYAVARALNVPVPNFVDQLDGFDTVEAGGFREGEIEPITPPDGEDFDANEQHWAIRGSVLQLAGFMPGDHIVTRAGIAPTSGDVVVAQVYDRTGAARTVIRLYRQPYITTASPNLAEQDIVTVDGERAVIMSVFVKLIRERRSAA